MHRHTKLFNRKSLILHRLVIDDFGIQIIFFFHLYCDFIEVLFLLFSIISVFKSFVWDCLYYERGAA